MGVDATVGADVGDAVAVGAGVKFPTLKFTTAPTVFPNFVFPSKTKVFVPEFNLAAFIFPVRDRFEAGVGVGVDTGRYDKPHRSSNDVVGRKRE